MSLLAGFSRVDISPRTFPVRTYWSAVDTVIDPLFTNAAVFHDGRTTIAFLSLDVVIVEREYALRIKEESPVGDTFVVSLANGWLGYIPHREAFERIGGHESTWCISSKMEPDAGDRMADAMLELIRTAPVAETPCVPVTGCSPSIPGAARDGAA